MMMTPITLPIVFHTDETRSLKEQGLSYSYRDCEIRDVDFWTISVTLPHVPGEDDEDDHGKEYTKILSDGETFICVLPYEDVKEMIIQHMRRHLLS